MGVMVTHKRTRENKTYQISLLRTRIVRNSVRNEFDAGRNNILPTFISALHILDHCPNPFFPSVLIKCQKIIRDMQQLFLEQAVKHQY